MSKVLVLVIIGMVHLLEEGQGLEWKQNLRDGAHVTGCVGDTVTFPWEYVLQDDDDLVGVTWNRRVGETDTSIANLFFDQFTLEETRITPVKEGGLELSAVMSNDSGSYSVLVRLNGVSDVASQTAHLLVAEKPDTDSGKLEVSIRETYLDTTDTSGGSVREQLTCGKFTFLGSPSVSVVWEGPDGKILNSSDFEDGLFILDLPEHHGGGNYNCMLNLNSTAVGCLPGDSALRDKSTITVSQRFAPSTASSNTVTSASLDGGAIAGVIIAVLVIIVIVVIVAIYVFKFRRGKSYSPKEPESPGPDQEAAEPLKA